jgi:hypothetical protein
MDTCKIGGVLVESDESVLSSVCNYAFLYWRCLHIIG